jgi:hypothetical protein
MMEVALFVAGTIFGAAVTVGFCWLCGRAMREP